MVNFQTYKYFKKMINKIQNIFLFAILFIAETITAQGPDPDNLPGDGNPTDTPIDANIFLLVLVALLFAYSKKFKIE